MPKRAIFIPAVLLLLIPAAWIFVSLTASPIFRSAGEVPSTMEAQPPPEWEAAAKQARELVRASVAAKNLPGLSVAVAVNGEVVWAEGFGFADLRTSTPVTPRHLFRVGAGSSAPVSAGDDEDFPLVNLVRELIHDPGATRDSAAQRRTGTQVSYYFPRFASNPKYGMHVMRPLESSFVATPSDLARAGKPLRGELLGGDVAAVVTAPDRRLVIAVTSNIAFADTPAFAQEISKTFR